MPADSQRRTRSDVWTVVDRCGQKRAADRSLSVVMMTNTLHQTSDWISRKQHLNMITINENLMISCDSVFFIYSYITELSGSVCRRLVKSCRNPKQVSCCSFCWKSMTVHYTCYLHKNFKTCLNQHKHNKMLTSLCAIVPYGHINQISISCKMWKWIRWTVNNCCHQIKR